MNTKFKADAKDPKAGLHVFFTIDGKSQDWGTIAGVNADGTLDINAHDDEGRIVGGFLKCKRAADGIHNVPKTWWV
jgi:hypothetical protein